MSLGEDEKKIQGLMSRHRMKEPPRELMRDYEAGVWKRIEASSVRRMWTFGLAAGLSLAAALALALGLWLAPEIGKKSPAVEEPTVTVSAPELPSAKTSPEAFFEELENELFVLEMLGEDEGFLDDTEVLVQDMDFLDRAFEESH